MFMGLAASAFLPAFAHALNSKNRNTSADKASLVVGGGCMVPLGRFHQLGNLKRSAKFPESFSEITISSPDPGPV
jgi:hypothetical protein